FCGFGDSGLAGTWSLDFTAQETGWVLAGNGSCAGYKTDCTNSTLAARTSDGGQTWTTELANTSPAGYRFVGGHAVLFVLTRAPARRAHRVTNSPIATPTPRITTARATTVARNRRKSDAPANAP